MTGFDTITNYVRLADDLGTSGQPTREQFRAIADGGFAGVVNLALADSDRAVPEEGSIVAALGMTYVHIPVRFDAPTVKDFRIFAGVMRAFDGTPVWVHCVVNARVSAFCYHYLRHARGYDEAAARSPVLERWAPQMDDVWRRFLALTPRELGFA